MSRQSRDLREEVEWLRKYAAESTALILDIRTAVPKDRPIPELDRRINRLRASCRVWDEVKKRRKEFVP